MLQPHDAHVLYRGWHQTGLDSAMLQTNPGHQSRRIAEPAGYSWSMQAVVPDIVSFSA